MTDRDKDPAAVALGHRGGTATSKRKTRAARRNAKQGGRPPELYEILRREGGWEAVYSTGRSLGIFTDRRDALAACRLHRDQLAAAARAAAALVQVPDAAVPTDAPRQAMEPKMKTPQEKRQ